MLCCVGMYVVLCTYDRLCTFFFCVVFFLRRCMSARYAMIRTYVMSACMLRMYHDSVSIYVRVMYVMLCMSYVIYVSVL